MRNVKPRNDKELEEIRKAFPSTSKSSDVQAEDIIMQEENIERNNPEEVLTEKDGERNDEEVIECIYNN